MSERGRFKLPPPSRERVVEARLLEDALRSALPAPGDMLLLRPPALPPAPSGPRHRAHARPLTNTPTYPRKPRRAASAGEGCATAVTPAACATVAPQQCQPSAGQQPIALWCSRSGSGPVCRVVSPPDPHSSPRARSSECGHRPCRQGRPDAAETPTGALTCSRVTGAVTLACWGGGLCLCCAGCWCWARPGPGPGVSVLCVSGLFVLGRCSRRSPVFAFAPALFGAHAAPQCHSAPQRSTRHILFHNINIY